MKRRVLKLMVIICIVGAFAWLRNGLTSLLDEAWVAAVAQFLACFLCVFGAVSTYDEVMQ